MKQLKTILITFVVTLVIISSVFAYFYRDYIKVDNANVENVQSDSLKSAANEIQTPDDEKTEQNDDKITNSRRTVITRAVEKVSPAIVGITVTEIRQYRSPFSLDPFWNQFFGNRVYNRKIKGLGSGTIISPDGYILTNDHVAGNAVEAKVTMTDGTEYEAKIIGTDPSSDVCLLKIDAENLPYVKFGNSSDIYIGEWVIALGNPFGLFVVNDKPTVTVGVVSATDMNLGQVNGRYYYDMIQTDAAINGGNSGGALVNSIGEIIGMNTLIYTAQGSSGNVGVGFAIPINKVKKVVAQLKKDGKIDRNFWTGLRIQMITKAIAKYYNLKTTKGVIVSAVEQNSPSDKAGIEAGDVIIQVNNYKIDDDQSLVDLLNNFQTDDVLKVHILRESVPQIINLKLEKRK
ncbi:MAG: PDZ domain-containing protein [Chlorobi bacterium]|nr:PDZ domain-containing protein [Chlorobiota bacterium]